MRFAVLLCACVLVALDGAQAAFAHARLVRSVPADGAVLPVAPRAVRVLFDNSVVPAAGIAAVRNGGGSVLAGKPRLAPGNRRELVIPLRPNLPRGDYSVRWRIMSDDGHLIAGVLAFAVGSGRAPPTSTLQAGGTGPSALDVFFRWLFLGGLLLAAGTGAFALAVWRPQVRGPLGHTRFAALLLFGCSFVVLGGIGELHGVSTATRFAIVTLVGAVYAGAVAALSAISFVERRLLLAGQAAAVPLALVPTLAGHALDPGRSWIEPVADVLHVSSAAVWLGGSVSPFAVGPSLRQGGGPPSGARQVSAPPG